MLRFAILDTPWGEMFIAANGDALCGTRLPAKWPHGPDAEARRRWPGSLRDDAILPDLQAQLRAYFAHEPVRFRTKVDLSAVSPYRRRVLEACRRVRYGKTTSYADLAEQAGNPRAIRAAGGAMANNPAPLIIPCHRVLRSDGGLGGFSAPGGLNLKRKLLAWEADH